MMRVDDAIATTKQRATTADDFFLRAYCVKCKTVKQMIPERENGTYVVGACAECGTKVARTWSSLCKDCR